MVAVATIMSFVCISTVDSTSPNLVRLLDGVDVEMAGPEEALERLKGARFDAVTVHLPLEQWDAEDLLEQIHRTQALVPVIICDPEGTMADAVRFTKLGAFYFTKGEDPDEFKQILQWACEFSQLRDLAAMGNAVSSEPWRKFLVGESRAMQQLMQMIRLVGKRRSTVLISGETGAGKEMVARAIHLASDRGSLPMVAVNCTALPENLLEAELFGHVKGAFTGAISHRAGRFEQAHRSTLFLDEVGDLPLDIQAKLLRVLQEREFQRIGSSETIKVDVRMIAASNIDLEQAVRDGKFREDLFYRLNVVPLRVPALRERPSDIPILVQHLTRRSARRKA
jgi:DNA-binding NtrC family response regulator